MHNAKTLLLRLHLRAIISPTASCQPHQKRLVMLDKNPTCFVWSVVAERGVHLHVRVRSRNVCVPFRCLLPGRGFHSSLLATFRYVPAFVWFLLMSCCSFNAEQNILHVPAGIKPPNKSNNRNLNVLYPVSRSHQRPCLMAACSIFGNRKGRIRRAQIRDESRQIFSREWLRRLMVSLVKLFFYMLMTFTQHVWDVFGNICDNSPFVAAPFKCHLSGSSTSVFPRILCCTNSLHIFLLYIHKPSSPPPWLLHIHNSLSSLCTVPPLHMSKLSQSLTFSANLSSFDIFRLIF